MPDTPRRRSVADLAGLPVTRRAGWTLVDQALSSGTNVAVSVLVARTVDTRGFGLYSLAFATYLLLGGISTSLFAQPLIIRFTALSGVAVDRAREAVLGGALGLGLGAGVVLAVLSVLLGGDAASVFRALALVIPGLLVQETCRSVFFASGAPRSAAANDGVWAAAQIVAFTVLLVATQPSVAAMILAWGGAATLAAVFGCWQVRVVPRPGAARRWLAQQRDLGMPFLGDYAATQTVDQLSVYALPVVAGVATLGAYRGGLLLFGPLNFLVLALFITAQPEGVRIRRRSLRQLGRAIAGMAAVLAAAAIALGALLLLLPDSYGREVLGQTWERARPLILPLTVFRVGLAFNESIVVGLRVLEAGRRMLRTRLLVALPGMALIVGGAALNGAFGAAVGAAIGSLATVPVWIWQYVRAARDAAAGDAASRDQPASTS